MQSGEAILENVRLAPNSRRYQMLHGTGKMCQRCPFANYGEWRALSISASGHWNGHSAISRTMIRIDRVLDHNDDIVVSSRTIGTKTMQIINNTTSEHSGCKLNGFCTQTFNTIPDYWDVKEQSTWVEKNAHKFGDVICQHGLHDVFGIALLHSHFKLNPGERLVRNYTNCRFSVAIGRGDFNETCVPYMWYIPPFDKGAIEIFPLEFCSVDGDTRRKVMAHEVHAQKMPEFFRDFSELIKREHAHNKVALMAMFQREMFQISENESLFEETHERNRLITLHVGESYKEDDYPTDAIRTSWSFSPSASLIDSVNCMSHCYAHCRSHETSRQKGSGI